MISRVAWFIVWEVVVVVVLGGGGVGETTEGSTSDHVVVSEIIVFWESWVSLSKISSPVISCSHQLDEIIIAGSSILQVMSVTAQVATIFCAPVREKCVPTFSFENDLISCKSWFAAFGLIKR